MENLLAVQRLELGPDPDSAENQAAASALRAKVPPQILGHFDRMLARGKKGVALVRNSVCLECHMRVPVGVVATLMHGTDLQICGSCGRYLHLAPEPEPTAAPKKSSRGRRKKSPEPLAA